MKRFLLIAFIVFTYAWAHGQSDPSYNTVKLKKAIGAAASGTLGYNPITGEFEFKDATGTFNPRSAGGGAYLPLTFPSTQNMDAAGYDWNAILGPLSWVDNDGSHDWNIGVGDGFFTFSPNNINIWAGSNIVLQPGGDLNLQPGGNVKINGAYNAAYENTAFNSSLILGFSGGALFPAPYGTNESGLMHFMFPSSTTNQVVRALNIGHSTSNSSTTGFGSELSFFHDDSGGTAYPGDKIGGLRYTREASGDLYTTLELLNGDGSSAATVLSFGSGGTPRFNKFANSDTYILGIQPNGTLARMFKWNTGNIEISGQPIYPSGAVGRYIITDPSASTGRRVEGPYLGTGNFTTTGDGSASFGIVDMAQFPNNTVVTITFRWQFIKSDGSSGGQQDVTTTWRKDNSGTSTKVGTDITQTAVEDAAGTWNMTTQLSGGFIANNCTRSASTSGTYNNVVNVISQTSHSY